MLFGLYFNYERIALECAIQTKQLTGTCELYHCDAKEMQVAIGYSDQTQQSRGHCTLKGGFKESILHKPHKLSTCDPLVLGPALAMDRSPGLQLQGQEKWGGGCRLHFEGDSFLGLKKMGGHANALKD